MYNVAIIVIVTSQIIKKKIVLLAKLKKKKKDQYINNFFFLALGPPHWSHQVIPKGICTHKLFACIGMKFHIRCQKTIIKTPLFEE